MKTEIFDTINLLCGDKIDILICRGSHIAKASFSYGLLSIQYNADITPFLMRELCRINGKKQDIDYFLDLLSDDYMKISESIGNVIKTIK